MKINGEAPFQVTAHSFGVSASNDGYTLNYSADGVSWTAWSSATPANEVLFVVDVPKSCYFKLVGNHSEVIITF